MTPDEVCEELGIKKSTLYQYLWWGKIKGFKVGALWRFSRKWINKWIEDKLTKRGFSYDKATDGET